MGTAKGVCQRCGCTDAKPCRIPRPGLFGHAPLACSWIDVEHTRCSGCFFAVEGRDGQPVYHVRVHQLELELVELPRKAGR
jgi:hypothetical protein